MRVGNEPGGASRVGVSVSVPAPSSTVNEATSATTPTTISKTGASR